MIKLLSLRQISVRVYQDVEVCKIIPSGAAEQTADTGRLALPPEMFQ